LAPGAAADQSNTLLAIWFTYPPGLSFAPDGSGQRWIYAQAPYDSTTDAVTLPAEILSGGRFPPLFNRPFDEWLKQNDGEVIWTIPLTLRASQGPVDWLLVKLRASK